MKYTITNAESHSPYHAEINSSVNELIDYYEFFGEGIEAESEEQAEILAGNYVIDQLERRGFNSAIVSDFFTFFAEGQ